MLSLIMYLFPLVAMASLSRIKVVRDGTSLIVGPMSTHSATVIIAHGMTLSPMISSTAASTSTIGLGDSANGFLDVAQMFAQQMPHTKFILPTAPTQPVTLTGGMRMVRGHTHIINRPQISFPAIPKFRLALT